REGTQVEDWHWMLLGFGAFVLAVWLFEKATAGVRNRNRARIFAELQEGDGAGLEATETPLGLDAKAATELTHDEAPAGTPVIGWALQGPISVRVEERSVELQATTFQLGWWRGGDEDL